MTSPSVAQLNRAIKIAEQIQSLKEELAAVLGSSNNSAAPAKRAYTKKAGANGRRKNSNKALLVEAVEAAEVAAPARKKRKKGKMSAEGRAAIVAAQKARWAKIKKQKKARAE